MKNAEILPARRILMHQIADILCEFGARWALQIAFWFGFGAGVGGMTAWWIAWRVTK